jgi:hypothetical protein
MDMDEPFAIACSLESGEHGVLSLCSARDPGIDLQSGGVDLKQGGNPLSLRFVTVGDYDSTDVARGGESG